jgi:hypothetical protein
MTYKFKGTNITDLITAAPGSTTLTGYSGFPPYQSNVYSTERPLPFNMRQQQGTTQVQVSNSMNAKFVELSGSGQYQVPSDYNVIRAVLEGGGGGGGGGASCGVTGGGSRKTSGPGGRGRNGGFVYVSDTPINPGPIAYSVGNGGAGGGGAPDGGNLDQTTEQSTNPGGDGQAGNTSTITFTTSGTEYTVRANTGNGGQGGGPLTGGTPIVTPAPNNYTPIISTDAEAQQISNIPANVNPISHLSAYSGYGSGGSDNNPGPGQGSPGGAGMGGYIRLYLLKQ